MDWEAFSQFDLEALCPPQILERGHTYYCDGHLLRACRFQDVLAGRFIGSGTFYDTLLLIEDGELKWNCNCPYPDFCKHLSALAYAWLENRQLFKNVDDNFLAIIDDPQKQVEALHVLVAKNPFAFLDFFEPRLKTDFTSHRAILNIIRNLFRYPNLKLKDVEELWERIQAIVPTLEIGIRRGDSEVIRSLAEIWEALVIIYRDSLNPGVKKILMQQLRLWRLLLDYFDSKTIEDCFHTLVENYFDPLLWDMGEEIRPVILAYLSSNRNWQARVLPFLNEPKGGYLRAIRAYEMIRELPDHEQPLEVVTQQLLLTHEGRLWLVDRWLEEQPDQAYRLAKAGLRTGSAEEQTSYRDRLIEYHRRRHEYKQAAALSYIQFMHRLDCTEYRRLQELLANFPDDLQEYNQRIIQKLTEGNEYALLVKVMVRAGEFIALPNIIFKMLNENQLLEVLDALEYRVEPGLLEYRVYPAVIKAAFEEVGRNKIKDILKFTAAYKKCCFQQHREDLWLQFALDVKSHWNERPDLIRRFGALLL